MKKKKNIPSSFEALIPDYNLLWKGISLFHVEMVSTNFSGALFFVLGQGLGDHVNGFRILHEIMIRFPNAKFIVYADLRWKELVERIKGIEIRWYPKAKDVLSKEGTNNPYDPAHAEIRKEVEESQGKAFLAYAHFPMPDRHASRETTLEATARTIGLELKDKARPIVPLLQEDLVWAEFYLKKQGLEKGRYAVIAPYSWPNKMWGKENFSEVIDKIFKQFGLKTIVISYPEIGLFENEGAICAFDLSLGQIAGLMNFADFYVGLDSGPSHMAASFDLPMVAIFIEKRTIPFEVRPLSPWCLNVVESFFSSSSIPRVETVLESVAFLLGKKHSHVNICPICGGLMNYVVTANDGLLRMMCACGTWCDHSVQEGIGEKENINNNFIDIMDKEKKVSFEFNSTFLTLAEYEVFGKWLRKEVPEKILITAFRQKPQGILIPDQLKKDQFQVSFDGLLIWLSRQGYFLKHLTYNDEKTFLSFEHGVGQWNKKFKLPWGKVFLKTTVDRYLRWFSFERWGNPETLVGIVKSQAELRVGYDDMLGCSWTAFLSMPSLRSFRWVVKSFIFICIHFIKPSNSLRKG